MKKILPLSMPSIKTITPLLGGSYYHIFNRGINRQTLFFQEKNYQFFLDLFKKYLVRYVDIIAFCLLSNHFHLVIRIKDKIQSTESFTQKERFLLPLKDEVVIGKVASNQFKRLFISYAMAVNKQERRVGALFDAKFKRWEIEDQEYLKYAIFYTHYNPEKHGYIQDFKNYRYSSYKAILTNSKTHVCRSDVLEIFGGKTGFVNYHDTLHDERDDINTGIKTLKKRTVLS